MGRAEHVIHREVDERHPRRLPVGTCRGAQRIVDQRADRVRRLRSRGEPGQRCDERNVVDLLQRTLTPARCGCPAAEYHQWRLVLLGGGHRAHPVGDAGSGGQRRDARHAGHLRPAFGRERGGLFVSGVDQPDILCLTAVVYREQVATGQGEYRVDSAGAQSSGDQVSGVDRRVGRRWWSGVAHVGSIISACRTLRRRKYSLPAGARSV